MKRQSLFSVVFLLLAILAITGVSFAQQHEVKLGMFTPKEFIDLGVTASVDHSADVNWYSEQDLNRETFNVISTQLQLSPGVQASNVPLKQNFINYANDINAFYYNPNKYVRFTIDNGQGLNDYSKLYSQNSYAKINTNYFKLPGRSSYSSLVMLARKE